MSRPYYVCSLVLILASMLRGAASGGQVCSVTRFGALADNSTDNTIAFRRAAAECSEVLVPPGVWMAGPFNMSDNTVLRVEGVIGGSRNPTHPTAAMMSACATASSMSAMML